MSIFNTRFLLRFLAFIAFAGLVTIGMHSDLFKIELTLVEESAILEDQLENSRGTREVFENLNAKANEIAQTYHQQNIWWVNVNEIAEKIKALPGVKGVIVERVPPKTLRVTIQPENIRFIYVTRSGKIYPVTESATILKNFRSKGYPDAPVTRDEKIIKNSKVLAQAVDLVSSLPPSGLFSQSTVAEIETAKSLNEKSLGKSDASTDFWLSLIQPDVKVKISSENASVKAERVERVLDYTRKHNLHARVIDSEYSKKVVVKLRKDR